MDTLTLAFDIIDPAVAADWTTHPLAGSDGSWVFIATTADGYVVFLKCWSQMASHVFGKVGFEGEEVDAVVAILKLRFCPQVFNYCYVVVIPLYCCNVCFDDCYNPE